MALDKPSVQQSPLYGARISGVMSGELSDGKPETILIVEVGHVAAVPWTKPEDLTCPVPEAYEWIVRSLMHAGASCVVFADGHTECLRADTTTDRLQARLTRAGKEPRTDDAPL